MKITLELIDTIIGIDQTGAKKGINNAKELPITVLKKDSNEQWEISPNITKLSKIDLVNLLKISNAQGTLICIDSVLGLPKVYAKGNKTIKHYIKKTAKVQGYGQKVAEIFFNSFKIENELIRDIEKELNANSVFTSRPYQKNIQTGTFRVWKDLSLEIDSFNIWPNREDFDFKKYTLIEGYPTMAWKNLNRTNRFSKDLSLLYSKFINIKNIKLISSQAPDHQDASLLALLCLDHLKSGIIFKQSSIEGNILI